MIDCLWQTPNGAGNAILQQLISVFLLVGSSIIIKFSSNTCKKFPMHAHNIFTIHPYNAVILESSAIASLI